MAPVLWFHMGVNVYITYVWLQGMTASTLNSLAALLAEYQSSQAAAGSSEVMGAGGVDPMVTMSDPLASLDASIKGAFSPGNVSLLKPWGQHTPEVKDLPTGHCESYYKHIIRHKCTA